MFDIERLNMLLQYLQDGKVYQGGRRRGGERRRRGRKERGGNDVSVRILYQNREPK